jgi:isopenicillin N synthase-like dioxygenase
MKIKVIDFESSLASVKFVKSLEKTGFAVLTNHSIDINLIESVYSEWEIFFNSDEKYNYKFDTKKQDGYFAFGLENAKNYSDKDLKEFFQIYGWGQYPDMMTQNTMLLFQKLCELASELLNWVEINCPNNISQKFSQPLHKMIDNSPLNMLRIIHYPPLRDSDPSNAIRASAHEDINLLTILCAATMSGLQAKDLNGVWHEVDTDPGMIVVNTGDMLQMLTDGYFPSTTHQVVNPINKNKEISRFSMPLFLHPNEDVKLSDKHTAGSYLSERLKEIGLR